MNNFNTVFLVVKKHCREQKKFAATNCFEIIAEEANVPLDKLPIYLDHLQGIGLIKYSMSEKFIYLTSFGKKHEKLTKE